jgi:streptolysin S family bacteriocin protoxin
MLPKILIQGQENSEQLSETFTIDPRVCCCYCPCCYLDVSDLDEHYNTREKGGEIDAEPKRKQ